jgi:hypothetical protein
MPDLTAVDIELIRRDVTGQGICFSHLADELVDHLCCDVENEMAGGLGFADAYRKVKASMGQRRLREIQEETLYSVDTKYRNMKKSMKISAIAGTCMLAFAALFKIMHFPMAGILTTLGGILLAFVFMPSALTVLWKETRSKKSIFLYLTAFLAGLFFVAGVIFKIQHWPRASVLLILAAVSGVVLFLPSLASDMLREAHDRKGKTVSVLFTFSLAVYILGILFKILHWPMSSILMVTGLAGLFFIVLPMYMRMTWKDESNVSAKFIFIIVGALALVIPSMLLNLSMQRNFDRGFSVMLDGQQAMFRYRSAENISLIGSNTEPQKEQLLSEIDARTGRLISVINLIEEKMITESEGMPGVPAGLTDQGSKPGYTIEIRIDALARPFSTAPYDDHLLPGTDSRVMLDNALRDYTAFLLTLDTPAGLSGEAQLLDPAEWFSPSGTTDTRHPLTTALHLLELMKNAVLVAEANAIRAILENQK